MKKEEKKNSYCPDCNLKFEQSEAVYCCKCGRELKPLELKVEPVQTQIARNVGIADPVCPTYTGATG